MPNDITPKTSVKVTVGLIVALAVSVGGVIFSGLHNGVKANSAAIISNAAIMNSHIKNASEQFHQVQLNIVSSMAQNERVLLQLENLARDVDKHHADDEITTPSDVRDAMRTP